MEYMMGTSDLERKRLEIQSKFFDPYTLRLLGEAGLADGSTLLDIGTGAGDVALAAASIVGPSGQIVGVDIEADMIDHARSRASEAGLENVFFKTTSPSLDDIGDTSDVVLARLVLQFQSDKVAMIRAAARLVRPGGTLVLIDTAWRLPAFWSCPAVDCYDRHMDELVANASRLGSDAMVGTRLVALFAEAGLPEPRMSAELVTGGKASRIVEYNLMNGDVIFEQARKASFPCPTAEQYAARRETILRAVAEADSQFFAPCLIGALVKP